MSITHQRQEKPYWCGNACLSMLFGRSQAEMAKLVGTKTSGTSSTKVCEWLTQANVAHTLVHFEKTEYKDLWWVPLLSKKHPLYLCCDILDRYFAKGKERSRCHAVLACDGLFYDPSNDQAQPFEAYCATFNRNLYVSTMIVFHQERKGYLSED